MLRSNGATAVIDLIVERSAGGGPWMAHWLDGLDDLAGTWAADPIFDRAVAEMDSVNEVQPAPSCWSGQPGRACETLACFRPSSIAPGQSAVLFSG
jgi:hypothetical protein